MKKIAVCLLYLLFTIVLAAQTTRSSVAAAYTLLGAYSKSADAFSFGANQASLANSNVFSAGIYAEHRFMLSELAFYKLATALPAKSGNFGLSSTYFGSAENNEIQVGLAYGRKLSTAISVGAQFNYYTVQVAGYGQSSTINFEAGFLLQITEQLYSGFHVYNPTGSKLNKVDEERLPSIYKAGIGYQPSEKFFVSAEIEKTEDAIIGLTAGAQYAFDKVLVARVGFTSATSGYYFGGGVLFGNLRLDVVASVHPKLGITPGLLLIYNAKEK